MLKHKTMHRVGAMILSAVMVLSLIIVYMPANAEGESGIHAPTNLLTNDLENPINVEGSPRFSWWLEHDESNQEQTAYQIKVTDEISSKEVWDSGKVISSEQTNVSDDSILDELEVGHPYSLTVSWWDSDGVQSTESDPAYFSTGLSDDDWDADWIQNSSVLSSSAVTTVESETAARVEGGELTLYKGDSSGWADYTVTADLRVVTGAAGVAFRATDSNNGYIWTLEPGTGLILYKMESGVLSKIDTINYDIANDIRYNIKIEVDGTTITTYLNGIQIDTRTDSTFSSGTVGLYVDDGNIGEYFNLNVSSPSSQETWASISGSSTATNQISHYVDGYAWEDYTLSFDAKISSTATAVMLRATNDYKSGYMWQLSLSKGLARHTMSNGSFTKLTEISYSLFQGQTYHVDIEVSGNTIKTYIDSSLVDTYTDTSNISAKGTIGFRHASGESGSYSNIKVVSSDGTTVLLDDAFSDLSKYQYSTGSQAAISVTTTGSAAVALNEDFSSLDNWTTVGVMTSVSDAVTWARTNKSGVTLLNQGTSWTDYILSAYVKIESNAAGIMFRANSSSGYMWQLSTSSGLKTHIQNNGSFTALKTVSDVEVVSGQSYLVTIEVNGDTFKTYIDGVLVDTTTDSTYSSGTIGFRESTTTTEIGQFSDITVVDSSNQLLFSDNFKNGVGNWSITGDTTSANFYW